MCGASQDFLLFRSVMPTENPQFLSLTIENGGAEL
jgi:hypothetical protein